MKNTGFLAALLMVLAATCTALAEAAAPEPAAQAATVDIKLVVGYAERLGIKGEVSGDAFSGAAVFDGKPYQILLVADTERFLCYLAVLDVFKLKADDPGRDAILARAMELNFKLSMGKLEWDREAGSIRLSHAFSTEAGLAYEEFRGVLLTLLSVVEPVRTELQRAK